MLERRWRTVLKRRTIPVATLNELPGHALELSAEWMEAQGGEEKGYLPLRLLYSETSKDMFDPGLATGFTTEAMVAQRDWIDTHKRSGDTCA